MIETVRTYLVAKRIEDVNGSVGCTERRQWIWEKILSSMCSKRSLGLLPPTSDRPKVPARAAAVARVIAGLPPNQRSSLPSSSENCAPYREHTADGGYRGTRRSLL